MAVTLQRAEVQGGWENWGIFSISLPQGGILSHLFYKQNFIFTYCFSILLTYVAQGILLEPKMEYWCEKILSPASIAVLATYAYSLLGEDGGVQIFPNNDFPKTW